MVHRPYESYFDIQQSSGAIPQKDVLVIGAGLSGLCAAFYLKQAGLDVDLFESGNHPGGLIQSHRSETGFLSELGPHTLQLSHPCILKLIQDLGIEDQMLFPPEGIDRLIVRNKTLFPLPKTLWQFIQSPLLTGKEKLRILAEIIAPPFENIEQLTLGQYFAERYGQAVVDYLIDPFVAGIYGGVPSELSFKYSFPKLFDLASGLEKKRKSLLLHVLRKGLHKKAPASVSFKEGLFTLPSALVKALGSRLHYEVKLSSLVHDRKTKRWSVSSYIPASKYPRYAEYKHLWVTIPNYKLETLPFGDKFLKREVQELASVDLYAPIGCLSLGIEKRYFKHMPRAFGFLTPTCEHFSILGALFTSNIFPNRSPEGYISLAAFAGGERARVYAEMSVEIFERLTLSNLATLGLIYPEAQSCFKHHTFWKYGIPQYTYSGQRTLENTLTVISKDFPTLHFSGNYIRGIALSSCIQHAHAQTHTILQAIAKAS